METHPSQTCEPDQRGIGSSSDENLELYKVLKDFSG
jgi:hypothetical protein